MEEILVYIMKHYDCQFVKSYFHIHLYLSNLLTSQDHVKYVPPIFPERINAWIQP